MSRHPVGDAFAILLGLALLILALPFIGAWLLVRQTYRFIRQLRRQRAKAAA